MPVTGFSVCVSLEAMSTCVSVFLCVDVCVCLVVAVNGGVILLAWFAALHTVHSSTVVFVP